MKIEDNTIVFRRNSMYTTNPLFQDNPRFSPICLFLCKSKHIIKITFEVLLTSYYDSNSQVWSRKYQLLPLLLIIVMRRRKKEKKAEWSLLTFTTRWNQNMLQVQDIRVIRAGRLNKGELSAPESPPRTALLFTWLLCRSLVKVRWIICVFCRRLLLFTF